MFHHQNGCILKKLVITLLEDDVDISRTDKTIKALHIENEIVNFLPRSLMQEFSECRILHVVGSEMKSIDKTTFEETKQLEHINLEKNHLTDLFRDTFSELSELKFLKLDKNKIKTVPSKAFVKNTALETLSLNFNEIGKIHENTFATLTKLKYLYVSNNKIEELRDLTFASNEALMTIDLSHNQLKEVGKEVFEPLEGSLKSLRLDNNKCIADNAIFTNKDKSLNLNDLKDKLVDDCLPFPIKDCQDEKEKLREANDGLKMELQSSKAREARLKAAAAEKQRELENEIENLKKESTDKSKEIKNLELRVARLNEVYDNRTAIIDEKNLAVDNWNICEQKLIAKENEAKAKGNLKTEIQSPKVPFGDEKCFTFEISCDRNERGVCNAEGIIAQFENMTLASPRIEDEILKISKSFLQFLSADIFSKFSNLKQLEIKDSHLRQISKGNFAAAGNLVHLEISKNPLTEVPENCFEGAEKLETLTLSTNKIEKLSSDAFKGLGRLTKLILNHNELTDILGGTFDDLTSLKILHMSGNRFQHLGGDILRFNANLDVLVINENPALMTIGESIIDSCPNIREVYYGLIGCVKERIKYDDIATFKRLIKQKCSV